MGNELVIKSHILHHLGQPQHMNRVHIVRVMKDAYRVNIEIDKLKGRSIYKDISISDSFYVKVQNNQVTHVDPPIVKRY